MKWEARSSAAVAADWVAGLISESTSTTVITAKRSMTPEEERSKVQGVRALRSSLAVRGQEQHIQRAVVVFNEVWDIIFLEQLNADLQSKTAAAVARSMQPEVLAGAKERRKLANQKAREEVQRRVSFSSLQAPKEEVRRYSAPWAGKFSASALNGGHPVFHAQYAAAEGVQAASSAALREVARVSGMSDEVYLEGVGWVPQAEANAAATKMQARYRGKAERKATAEKKQKQKEAKEETAAATKVQSIHRGKKARQKTAEMAEEKRVAETHRKEEEAAATKVQAIRRGQTDRKAAAEKKQQRKEETEAATKMQAVHRGKASRKMTQQQKEEAARRRKLDQEQTTEAKEAEALSTGLLPVADAEQAAAATKVQAMQRGKVARKKTEEKRAAEKRAAKERA